MPARHDDVRPRSRVQPGILVAGFALSAAGNAFQSVESWNYQFTISRAQVTFQTAGVAAIVLLAWGGWAWFRYLQLHPPDSREMTTALRATASAYFVTSLGYLALTYSWARAVILGPATDTGFSVELVVSVGMQFAGAAVVFAAFWRASRPAVAAREVVPAADRDTRPVPIGDLSDG